MDSKYDIVIISETWLINHETYKTNPLFLSHSVIPTNLRTTGHQNGGILILTHPSLMGSITIISHTEYSILIDIHGTKIATVYLPPQLTDLNIKTELENLNCPDILLGDLNVRLGSLSGDITTTFPSRRQTISSWATPNHLEYLRNSNQTVSRTDHVYTRKALTWTYHWDLPFKTDHGLMSLLLNIKKEVTPILPSTRFNLKPFTNSFFRMSFASFYEYNLAPQIASETHTTLSRCLYSMILPNTKDTQTIIDFTYESFILSLHQTMSFHLNVYDAKLIKVQRDPVLEIPENASNTQIMRAYKRLNRGKKALKEIVSTTPSLSPLNDCLKHYKQLYSCNEDPPQINRTNDVEFSLNMTTNLIKETIRNYSNTKSSGQDNIHTLILKSLTCSPTFIIILTNLFQTFTATGLVPTNFSICRLHLLLKDENNPIASKTRPIVLSSIIRRIFEKCLMKIWFEKPQDWMRLHPSQGGFRRGFNCHSHLILSDEISRRDCPLSIFLDLTSAFDNLRWNKLATLLTNLSVPAVSHSLILSLICKPLELELSVNQSNTASLNTFKGVFQGGGISAFIFALYINPLAISLNLNAPSYRPLALLFADDVQLKPRDPHEAQLLLNICSTFAKDFKIPWNISKCAAIGLPTDTLTLSNQRILPAASYKYLGMIHHAKGIDWEMTLQKAIEKQNNILTSLSDKPWSPRVRLTIYRTFIRPLTDYSAPLASIWAEKLPKKRAKILELISKHHKAAHRFIFQVRTYSPILSFLSRLGPFTHHLEMLKSGLACFLNYLDPTNPLTEARRQYCISSSPNFILPLCFKSSYLKAYQSAKAASPKQRLSYDTWSSRKLIELFQTSALTSTLPQYIDPSCIKKERIAILFQLPTHIFRQVIKWRINRCFLGRKCKCGMPFRRTHLTCLLSISTSFQDLTKNIDFIQNYDDCPSKNFSPLDYLLNIDSYSLFSDLLSLAAAQLPPID